MPHSHGTAPRPESGVGSQALLEKRWAYEKAKDREQREIAEFMGIDGDEFVDRTETEDLNGYDDVGSVDTR